MRMQKRDSPIIGPGCLLNTAQSTRWRERTHHCHSAIEHRGSLIRPGWFAPPLIKAFSKLTLSIRITLQDEGKAWALAAVFSPGGRIFEIGIHVCLGEGCMP
jgi:hypothetical protein